MATITLGSEATDRPGAAASATIICEESPASHEAHITDVEIWAHISLTGAIVATFYNTGGNNFTARDNHAIGNVASGAKRTSTGLNLLTAPGDYIGLYFGTGNMELATTEGQGVWLNDTGDLTSSSGLYTHYSPWIISLKGTATTFTAYAPTVTTQAVSSITEITGTGNGNITVTGGFNSTVRGFCYVEGDSGDPTTADSTVFDFGSFGTGAFSKSMTGLTKGTDYRARAYAINPKGTSYGSTVQFTTPGAITQTPTNIIRADPTTVTANALIKLDVTEEVTTRGFKYGLTSTGDTDVHSTGSFSAGSYTETVTSLTDDTSYYIRAYIIGTWGTTYGSYLEFKTAYPYGSFKTEIKSEATASASDINAVGGKRSLTIKNHLIQSETVADLISAAYLADYKDQKTKLVVARPTPAPYEVGDTIKRIGAKLPYYTAVSALISYAAVADAEHYYNLARQDMIIRKLNISFSAGNYVSVIELESS